ncbi:phosphatase PAP2 family protein [soil metagenome]
MSAGEASGGNRSAVDLPRFVRARLDPAERYGLRLTLVGVAFVLVAIPFASLTFAVLDGGGLTRADGRVADSLNRWVHDRSGAVGLLQGISWMGRPPLLAAVVLVAVLLVWRTGHRRRVVFLVATSLGGGIVDTLVKAAVDRPRPVVDHPVATALGKSFPSGHAMSSTVTYGALLVAVWPWIPARFRRSALVATVLLVLAVGTSRLFLGVHFVSDVVGGYVLGLAWLAAATAVFAVWRREEPVAALDEPDPATDPVAAHGRS